MDARSLDWVFFRLQNKLAKCSSILFLFSILWSYFKIQMREMSYLRSLLPSVTTFLIVSLVNITRNRLKIIYTTFFYIQ